MKTFVRFVGLMCAALGGGLLLPSCVHREAPELTAARAELKALQQQQSQLSYSPESYEYFVSHNQYPVTINIYKDKGLLARAKGNSRVVICLQQQRGRLYVRDKVAADWPVSTGVPGRATPTGNFAIRDKRVSYSSNRYGKFVDSSGKCVNRNADAMRQAVPDGGRFIGSPMPYWMRLTSDGVGMHVGTVRAGRRLSHGCIRTPREMAEELYRITSIGTRVSVVNNVEPEFPVPQALAAGEQQNSLEKRIYEQQKKVYDLYVKTHPTKVGEEGGAGREGGEGERP